MESLGLNNTFKVQTKKNEFQVKDVVKGVVPKVDLLTKNSEGYDFESLKEILELNVDLNNNNGLSESLVEPGLITKWDAHTDQTSDDGYFDDDERIGVSSDDKYAKYAIVVDTIGTQETEVYFFVPVGSNIYED